MLNYFENDYAKYLLINNIVHITYKNDVYIDLKAGIQIVKDRLIFHQDQFFPILCDIRRIKEVSKPARDYFALEGSALIKAIAFIVKPPVTEILSNFYVEKTNPSFPIESFEKISKAKVFLNGFL